MIEKKRDLRIQKTYDSLIVAFQTLLEEKSFESITVKELCARARTRTATFYSHFDDKYDFFSFMVRELRRNFTQSAERTYTKNQPESYYIELLCIGMDFLEQNRKMVLSIKDNPMLVTMMHTVSDEMTAELETHIRNDTKNQSNNPDTRLQTQCMIGALNQVTNWWFSSRGNIDKDLVIQDMTLMIRRILYQEPINK